MRRMYAGTFKVANSLEGTLPNVHGTGASVDVNEVGMCVQMHHLNAFLPCDAMCYTVFVIVILSVRLSVTLVHCVHMVQPTIVISSPYCSPIIQVSGDITFIPKFQGGHPERGH